MYVHNKKHLLSDPPQPGNLTTGVNITAELVDEDVFRCIITSRGLQLVRFHI